MRLSEEEATRLAHQAVTASPLAAKLVLRGAWASDGRLAWHFWMPTLGSSLTVVIDDLSGEAQVQEQFGRKGAADLVAIRSLPRSEGARPLPIIDPKVDVDGRLSAP